MAEDAKTTRKSITSGAEAKLLGLELGLDVDKRVLRMVGLIALEVLALGMLILVILMPRWEELKQLRGDLSSQEQQYNKLELKLAALNRFEENRDRYETIQADAFPPVKDVGLVLSSLRQLAVTSGIEIVSYSLDPVTIAAEKKGKEGEASVLAPLGGAGTVLAGAKTESFSMELTIGGTAGEVQQFLSLINTSLPFKVVENVLITAGEVVSESSGEFLEMKLLLTNYFLPVRANVDPAGAIAELGVEKEELVDKLADYISLSSEEASAAGGVQLGNPNLFGL